MRASTYHQMVAAAAVRELGVDPSEIESVDVDGVEVSDLEKAEARLEHNEGTHANSVAKQFDKLVMKAVTREDKLAGFSEEERKLIREMKPFGSVREAAHELKEKFDHSKMKARAIAANDRFEKTKVGATVGGLVRDGDPEQITYSATVNVKLKSGLITPVTVKVDDDAHSLPLQRLAIGVAIASTIPVPFGDKILPAAVGVGMLLSSGVALAANNPQLAKTLKVEAQKYGALTVAALVPGAGKIVRAQGLVKDANDIKELLTEPK